MGILEIDFERILGVPFFFVVLTPSYCGTGKWFLLSLLVLYTHSTFFDDLIFQKFYVTSIYGNSVDIDFSKKLAHSMIEWELLRKKGTPKILSKSISRVAWYPDE